MSSKIVLAWAAFGWFLLVSLESAKAQGRAHRAGDVEIMKERSFPPDFRALDECLERLARGEGLTIQYAGSGTSWNGLGAGHTAAYTLFADERTFPLLKDLPLAYLGRLPRGAKAESRHKIMVDLDTGKLTSQEGIDLSGWQLTRIDVRLTLREQRGDHVCQVHLSRDYSDKDIKISMTSNRGDGQVPSRDLVASLESKLKLAAKLKDAKAKKGPERPK